MRWSRTSSIMSSSSHKRHRLTQKEVRELFDARSVSERSMASDNNQDESIAKNQTTTPSTSNRNPPSLPRFASLPTVNPQDYETPLAQKDPPAPQSRSSEQSEQSEPSTFLSLEAASSMSTIPSEASSTRFVRRPSPDTFSQAFPIAAVNAGITPNETFPRPTTMGLSSVSFNLLHRRDSFGHVQFGTQSSPPKSMILNKSPNDALCPNTAALLNTNDQASDDRTTTGIRESQYTTATAIVQSDEASPQSADPSTANPPPADTDPNAPAPTFQLTRHGAVHQRIQAFPNLKLKVKKVTEGAFLLHLRRHPPLPCANPGDAPTRNAPLIIVSPTADPKQPLTLTSNFCSQLMRRSKNYTHGVMRSTNGTNKQQRYQSKTKKRKQADADSTETSTTTSNSASSSSQATNNTTQSRLEFVSSFGLRTLLIEDVWFLPEGKPVVLFFNDDLLPPRYGKRWLKVWRDTSQCLHLPTVFCLGKEFKQLCGWVLRNGDTEHVTGAYLLYEDIVHSLKESTQRSIHLKLPIFSSDESCSIISPPEQCLEQHLSWFELFSYPQAIFLQADYHNERNWNDVFKQLKDDGDDRLTLFHRLVQETHGDRSAMSDLRHIWFRFQTKIHSEKYRLEWEEKLQKAVEEASQQPKVPPPLIQVDVIDKFCKLMDERILERLEDCFGRFNNIFEKILSEHELRRLATDLEEMLPNQFNALMSFNGYKKESNRLQSKSVNFFDTACPWKSYSSLSFAQGSTITTYLCPSE